MKFKNILLRILNILILFVSISHFLPLNNVYAQDKDINGIQLNIDNNTGKLTIKANPENIATEEEAINAGLSKFKMLVLVIFGFATLTLILVFIKNFTLLGISSTNPQARSNAIISLILSGIATAGLGGIMIFFTFFYTLFQ